MTRAAECRILGRWRLIESDDFDRDYLDLVGPATFVLNPDGTDEFTFGALQATMTPEYSQTTVFFRFIGSDEGDEISGNGSAELADNGSLEIELSFDSGDEFTFKARRE